MDNKQHWKIFLQAAKIGFGSALAMYLAHLFGLEFASSAGSITLLTILTTKWETVKLSLFRILTFIAAVFVAWGTLTLFHSDWFAYGCFLMIMTLLCDYIGWRSALSVNAVIGMHFLDTLDFSAHAVANELYLLLIGITIALVLNQFTNNRHRRQDIINWMKDTERRLQIIVMHLAAYFYGKELEADVWGELRELEKLLIHYINEANEYQGNTFQSHPGYYIDYFEMRRNQCSVLSNLHTEITRIRTMPQESRHIAEYMVEMANYVVEKNVPTGQLEQLEQLVEYMRSGDPITSADEFENRALIFHILIDLREFLEYKINFVENLDEEQRRRYWNA